jgi:TRAP-type C4-dicarboxylate transport system substrate-binding protein
MSTYLQVLVSSARHRVPRDFRDHHRHDGASMIKVLARYALLSFALLPAASIAEPVTLKLAFFSSDRSLTYRGAIKPFIDAVNSEAGGVVKIDLYSGGILGKEIAEQPQVVLERAADIAFVVPGFTPDRFPDNSVLELPGLLRDIRTGTFIYTRLTAANALKGYEGFFVIGALITEPESIHTRTPINSIGDLKGKRIRVNNIEEAAALRKLGAIPVPMQITRISDAISKGTIDGAMVSLSPLSDFGIKRVATSHYFLETSGAPLALLMNRKSFDALPGPAQNVIRKYSGAWVAERFIETYEVAVAQVMDQLKSEPNRKLTFPSQPDLDIANAAFKSVVAEWSAESPHHRELLELVESEITKLRSNR